MIFYRTNRDYVPAVLKTQICFSCCQNIMLTGRALSSIVLTEAMLQQLFYIILTGGLLFPRVLKYTMLQLLLLHHDIRRSILFYSSNKDHAPAFVITS